MFNLQEEFDNKFKELCAPKSVLRNILIRSFSAIGIDLNNEQQESIIESILHSGENSLRFSLDNKQLLKAGYKDEEEVRPLVEDIFERIQNNIDKYYSELFENKLPEMINEIPQDIAPVFLQELKKEAPRMLLERRDHKDEFCNNLDAIWGTAFDLLEMQLVIVRESAEYILKRYREDSDFEKDLVLETILLLHSRSCQIAGEVIVLLKNGYADGAIARWRSLHEITVVASFIADKNDPELAERYLLHEKIEAYKAAIQYRKYSEELELEEISDSELKEIEEARNELVNRFGRCFKNEYGWASDVLGNQNPRFSDIESNIEMDHYRPYFKFASNSIHAGSKGAIARLGNMFDRDNLLHSGPSNIGFVEPGHCTAQSLTQITAVLLTHDTTIDTLVISNMLMELVSDVGEALINAHTSILEKEDHSQ